MPSSHPYLREYDRILSMLPGKEGEEPFYYDEKEKAYLLKADRFERMLHELSAMSKRRKAGEEPFYSFRKKGNRDCLSIKNYVGVLSLGKGLQLEVLPKVDLVGSRIPESPEEERRKLLHILVSMLAFLPDFPGRPGDSAYFQDQEMELREFFIGLYLRKAERLFQEGLRRSYREVKEELPAPRGRLDVHKASFLPPGKLHGDSSFRKRPRRVLRRPAAQRARRAGDIPLFGHLRAHVRRNRPARAGNHRAAAGTGGVRKPLLNFSENTT